MRNQSRRAHGRSLWANPKKKEGKDHASSAKENRLEALLGSERKRATVPYSKRVFELNEERRKETAWGRKDGSRKKKKHGYLSKKTEEGDSTCFIEGEEPGERTERNKSQNGAHQPFSVDGSRRKGQVSKDQLKDESRSPGKEATNKGKTGKKLKGGTRPEGTNKKRKKMNGDLSTLWESKASRLLRSLRVKLVRPGGHKEGGPTR